MSDRWVRLEELGVGGMGVVHRAQPAGGGPDVALKTLRAPTRTTRSALRREVVALSRLAHPGIVRIVDHDVRGDEPWYAMELVPGRSLRAWIGRPLAEPTAGTWVESAAYAAPTAAPAAATPRRDDSEVLTLVRRLCAPLAYLHGEGLVHRDLKPGNIVVRPSGLPVVVDFGLAVAWRETVGGAGALGSPTGGTVAYVAPEQIVGGAVDARADLYALGCMLFELLTGRPPFVDATAAAVLHHHLYDIACRPSDVVPRLDPRLDGLVAALLEKRPRDRLGSAQAVAEVLSDLGAEPWPDPVPEPRSYLYLPPVGGREAEIGQVVAGVQQAVAGLGSAIVVVGESGVGKSSLLAEAIRRSPGALVLVAGEALPGSATPLGAVAPLLAELAALVREHPERATGGEAFLAAFSPELAAVVDPAPLGDGIRERAAVELTRALGALCHEGPVVLVVEDLQWADNLTLGWLGHLVADHALRELPAMVLATCRTERTPRAVQDLVEAPSLERVCLGRLGPEAVALQVAEMLASEPPPALIQFVEAASEGNPLFVTEYLRAAVAGGLLVLDHRGRWRLARGADPSALGLPDELRGLIDRRLSTLDAGAREVVEALAVLGREALREVIEGVVGRSIDAELADLLAAQVAVEEGESVRLVHHKVREVAQAGLDAHRARSLHGRAAEILVRRPDAAARALEIGRHLTEAGRLDQAPEWLIPGVEAAVRRHAWSVAESALRGFLAGFDGPDRRTFWARNTLAGDALQGQRRFDDAVREAEQLVADADAVGDPFNRWVGTMAAGNALWRLARLDEAEARCRAAIAGFQELDERASVGRALNSLGAILGSAGRTAEAVAALEQSLPIARSLGNDADVAQALVNLAGHQIESGDPSPAYAREAVALYRRLGNRRGEVIALQTLGGVAYVAGRLDEAVDVWNQARELAEATGLRGETARTRNNIAFVLAHLGRLDEAEAELRAVVPIQRELGELGSVAIALFNLIDTLLQVGRPGEALDLGTQALEAARRASSQRWAGNVSIQRAKVLRIVHGDLATCRACLDGIEVPDALVQAELLCERGHLALALGQDPGDLLDRARAALEAGGATEAALVVGLATLERALVAERLFRGSDWDDLPERLRWWLQDQGAA